MATVYFTAGGHPCRASFTEFGLSELHWGCRKHMLSPSLPDMAKVLKKELDEYFEGTREEFSLPLDLEGVTDFQFDVFEQLLLIPYGETASYGEIANRVGKPKGAQAVGQAVKRNPIGIIIA